MGIEELRKIKKGAKATMVMEMKNFKEVGYWLRDIKNKMQKYELEKIKVIISVEYIGD